MLAVNHILAVIQPDDDASVIIERAQTITELFNAELQLAVMRPVDELAAFDYFDKDLQRKLRDDLEQDSRERLKYDRKSNLQISIQVVWYERMSDAILDLIDNQPVDLLLKAPHSSNPLLSFISTPTDYHLLRKAACPVWMIKPSDEHNGGILGAVDIGVDEQLKALASKIIETVELLSKKTGKEAAVLNTFPILPPGAHTQFVRIYEEQYLNETQQKNSQLIELLIEQLGIQDLSLEVSAGQIDVALNRYFDEHDVGLLVMGTSGRTGLSGALWGNTSERILSSVPCDVLVLK